MIHARGPGADLPDAAGADQDRGPRGRRRRPRRRRGRGRRLPRAQRRGQDHHAADADHAAPADRGHRDRRRATTWSRESEQVRRSIGYVSQAGVHRQHRPGRRGGRSTTACSTACRSGRRQAARPELFDALDLAGLWDRQPKTMSGRPAAAARHRDGADPRARRWCSSTSRPPGSTRRPAPTCGSTSPPARPSAAPRSSSPRTTSTRPTCWRPHPHHRPRADRRRRHGRQPQGAGRPATSSTSRSPTPSR